MIKRAITIAYLALCVAGCSGADPKVTWCTLAAWATEMSGTSVTCAPESRLVVFLHRKKWNSFPLSELTNYLPVAYMKQTTDQWGRDILVQVTAIDESEADIWCNLRLTSRGQNPGTKGNELSKETHISIVFPTAKHIESGQCSNLQVTNHAATGH